MNPSLLKSLIIEPVLHHLDWPQPRERALILCAIAIQESGLRDRRQYPNGPARSWWQIEPLTCEDCVKRCEPVKLFWKSLTMDGRVTDLLEYNDIAACAVAAGILRLTPGLLPAVGDVPQAWEYYLAAWRPGKPRREAWLKSYNRAL